MPTLISRSRRKSRQVDAESPVPLFFQVAELLTARLRDENYRVGQRFTTVRAVAADYGISFVTAQKALARLADQRLVRSERGRGTTVLADTSKRKTGRRNADAPATATRRIAVLWPTHLPVATALRSNLLATVDGLRAALPNYSIALEFAGELLLEDRAQDYLDSLVAGGNLAAFGLLSAPSFVKRYFEDLRVPAVVLGDVEPGIALSCVSSDEEQAQYDLTKHLIKKGHRRIAQIISAPRVAGHEPRLRGYRRALADAGRGATAARGDWELTLPHDRDEAMARFKGLLGDAEPPTAAICTGLPLASWVKESAGKRFHVAYDVDRDPLHAPLRPSTILVWPGERMGRLAGELLSRQIAGDLTRRQEMLGYSQIKDYA
jgi:DNA-binding transcriptional regulator YhcF (GntR family)